MALLPPPDEYQKRTSDSYRLHVVGKLRQTYPAIAKDANDDELLAVWHRLNIPDATPDEAEEVLRQNYGHDWTPPNETLSEKASGVVEKGKQIGKALPEMGKDLALGAGEWIGAGVAGNVAGKAIVGAAGPVSQAAMAVPTAIKLAGEQKAGQSIEKTAAGMQEPDIADMRAKGYSDAQIHNVVKGYVDTLNSLMEQQGEIGRQGVNTATGGIANAAFLNARSKWLEELGKLSTGKLAAKGVSAGMSKVLGSMGGHAVGGAVWGGGYMASQQAMEQGVQAAAEGKKANEILGASTMGLLSGAGTGVVAGVVLGGALGGIAGSVGALRGASAARKALAEKAMADAKALGVRRLADTFQPTWLHERFQDDLKLANEQGLPDETLAQNIVVATKGSDVLNTPEGQKAVATIAEKITKWRSVNEGLGGPMLQLRTLPDPTEQTPFTEAAGTAPLAMESPATAVAPTMGGMAPDILPPAVQGPIGQGFPQPIVPEKPSRLGGLQRNAPGEMVPPAMEMAPVTPEGGVQPRAEIRQPIDVTGAGPGPEPQFNQRDVGALPVTPRTPPAEMSLSPASVHEGIKATQEGGGSSYNARTLEPSNPTKGFTISIASENIPTQELTPERLTAFREKWKGVINQFPEATIGTFNMDKYKPGQTSLDLNIVLPEGAREDAVALGKQHQQFSIWDNAKGQEIKTGFSGEQGAPPTPEVAAQTIGKALAPMEPNLRDLPAADHTTRVMEAFKDEKGISLSPSEGGKALQIKKLGITPDQLSTPGQSAAILDKLNMEADKRGLPVETTLSKTEGPKGGNIPLDKLIPWYESRGFKVVSQTAESAVLRREPQGPPATRQTLPPELKNDVVQAVEEKVSPMTENLEAPPQRPGPGKAHQLSLFADTQIAAAKKRMVKRGVRLNAMVDPADLADISIIGANYMLKGAVKFAEWSDSMVKEFGEQVRPHLQKLYQHALALYQARRPQGNDLARTISADYLWETGLGAGRASEYHPLDEGMSRRIAVAYDRLSGDPITGQAKLDAKKSYDALVHEVDRQYAAIERAGVKIEFVDRDPYPNSAEMMKDVQESKRLQVYKTAPDQAHPFLTPEQNDKLRAVHDFFGHASEGYEFGPRGEDNAWRKHASMFSNMAIPAMTTETRGQNSWVNFMPGHDAIPPSKRPFAEQKFGLLPEWTYKDVIEARTKRAETPKLAAGAGQPGRGAGASVEGAAKTLSKGIRPVKSEAGQIGRALADGVSGVTEHLTTMPESADWYHNSIKKMEQATEKEYPDMQGSPSKMSFFKLLLAITSPQTPVATNYARATMLYDGFKETGKLPLLGRQGQEVNILSRSTLPKMEKLLEKHGNDLTALHQYMMGKDEKGNYNAVKEFGPKVGRFFLNLNGIHNEVTVDVWMTRWWRRINGLMHDQTDSGKVYRPEKPGDPEHRSIMDAVSRIAQTLGLPESAVQASIWDREKAIWSKAGLDSPSLDFAQAAEMINARRNARAAEVATKLQEPAQRNFFGFLQDESGAVTLGRPDEEMRRQQKQIDTILKNMGVQVQPKSVQPNAPTQEAYWMTPEGKLFRVKDHEDVSSKAVRALRLNEKTSGYQGLYRWDNHALLQRGYIRVQNVRGQLSVQSAINPSTAQRNTIATALKGKKFFGVMTAMDGSRESKLYEKWTDFLREADKE